MEICLLTNSKNPNKLAIVSFPSFQMNNVQCHLAGLKICIFHLLLKWSKQESMSTAVPAIAAKQ